LIFVFKKSHGRSNEVRVGFMGHGSILGSKFFLFQFLIIKKERRSWPWVGVVLRCPGWLLGGGGTAIAMAIVASVH
jgi:hypothetical protein